MNHLTPSKSPELTGGASLAAMNASLGEQNKLRVFEEWPNVPEGVVALPVPRDHPMLREKIPPFSFTGKSNGEVARLAYEMYLSMLEGDGAGLAANQMGWRERCFVMRTNVPIFAANPTIIDLGGETDRIGEGCLSFPGLTVKVKRSDNIRLRYQDIMGHIQSKTLTGFAARVAQHELDHLDGVTFFERAHPHHRDQAKRAWKLMQRRS